MKCGICSRERPGDACVVLQLTEEEKAAVQTMGEDPKETYVYCKPCYNILSNREQGAQLIRGVFQHTLKAEGVSNAEHLAQRYYEFLTRGGRP